MSVVRMKESEHACSPRGGQPEDNQENHPWDSLWYRILAPALEHGHESNKKDDNRNCAKNLEEHDNSPISPLHLCAPAALLAREHPARSGIL